MSGHALEDGLEAVEAGEVAEDSVEVCGWQLAAMSRADTVERAAEAVLFYLYSRSETAG